MAETEVTTEKKPSVQDTLTEIDINELLENFIRVDNVNSLKLGTEIRYFLYTPTGEKKFRFGGKLIAIKPTFIMLMTSSFKWSVKLETAELYRERDIHDYVPLIKQEISESFHNLFLNFENRIKKLEKENKDLKNLIYLIQTKLIQKQ